MKFNFNIVYVISCLKTQYLFVVTCKIINGKDYIFFYYIRSNWKSIIQNQQRADLDQVEYPRWPRPHCEFKLLDNW